MGGLLDLAQSQHPPGLRFPGGCRPLVSFTHKRLMAVSATAPGPIAVDLAEAHQRVVIR